MLVFVIPVKSRKVAQSWELVSRLFERCVRSLCNQTIPEFKVIVVCHERPEINFSHPNLTYLDVDFPIPDPDSEYSVKITDKGRKLLAGFLAAQAYHPTHMMGVDADDCVSRQLAQFVKDNSTENGWYIDRGYLYDDTLDEIFIRRRKFYLICGSCNIIRTDLMKLPEKPEYDRGYGYYKFYLDHNHVAEKLAQDHTPIEPLPFPGAVYVIETTQNTYYNRSKSIYGGNLARLFNRRSLTPILREEFRLPPKI